MDGLEYDSFPDCEHDGCECEHPCPCRCQDCLNNVWDEDDWDGDSE